MGKLVVMKFGGTSVATKENRRHALAHVKAELAKGSRVVAVISAMGRKGAPYATDTLLSMIRQDADPETRDLLINCGETIATCVFADELCQEGIPARPFTAEGAKILTDNNFGNADIINIDPVNIMETLDRGIVPVITGFQGRTADGLATTIGRGGSDASAAIIGGYLKADEVCLYTDVPGVAKTDPRIVPYAAFMDSVSALDMQYLSNWGAFVIHPKAMAAVVRFRIPVLRVRSTFDTSEGTSVILEAEKRQGLVGVALIKSLSYKSDGEYALDGRRYGKVEGGAFGIITAICYGITDDQMKKLNSEFPMLLRNGNTLQAVVPMERAGELTKLIYDTLN